MAKTSFTEFIAASLMHDINITFVRFQSDPEKVRSSIAEYMTRRKPETIAKIIWKASHPVDISGIECKNGKTLLQAAATDVIFIEIKRQLNLLHSNQPAHVIPKMRAASRQHRARVAG